jgi:hypothetical protein
MTRRSLLVLFLLSSFLISPPVEAQKNFSMDVGVGAPQLISLELAFIKYHPFMIGLGFGMFPVQTIAQSLIPLSNMPVNLGTADTYRIVPVGYYTCITTAAFIRAYPLSSEQETGWWIEVNFSNWKFGASVYGNLENQTTGVTTSSVITGTADLYFPLLTGATGYTFKVMRNYFMQIGLGASYLFSPYSNVTLGGLAASVLPVYNGTAQTSYDNAKASLTNQVDSALTTIKNTTRWLPSLFIRIGGTF